MPTADEAPPRIDRWRGLAERVVRRLGGLPAVRTLLATLTTYDRAGGGLIAAGLAYAALIALLPGMLLVLSIFAILISDVATRERIVSLIAEAVPPLEDVVRTAFEQVSAGAVPTGILAFIGLLWGASRFYAALDYAFTRVFHSARPRNEIQRTLRGVFLVGVVVMIPLLALLAGTIVGWVAELVPNETELPGWLRGDLALALHLASYAMFVGVVLLVLRFVPAERVATRALLVPGVAVGLALGLFTQLFSFLAPLLTHVAAIYGTFLAAFAVLAWMSISFNVLLLGACWTRVRSLAMTQPDAAAADPSSPGASEVPAG
jgi:membrane protein